MDNKTGSYWEDKVLTRKSQNLMRGRSAHLLSACLAGKWTWSVTLQSLQGDDISGQDCYITQPHIIWSTLCIYIIATQQRLDSHQDWKVPIFSMWWGKEAVGRKHDIQHIWGKQKQREQWKSAVLLYSSELNWPLQRQPCHVPVHHPDSTCGCCSTSSIVKGL